MNKTPSAPALPCRSTQLPSADCGKLGPSLGASADAETGSRASTEPASSLRPTGFDPARGYVALKLYGHSAAKAAEIILDAERGDDFSRRYVALILATIASGQ